MKTLIVGDLHGRIEVAEQALKTEYPVVFLGDYLDSFDRSVDDQVKTLRLVLDAVKDGKAKALLGNHEMSYLYPEQTCSGWKQETQTYVEHLKAEMLEHMHHYLWVEGFLLTHAGLSKDLLEMMGQDMEEYLTGGKYFQVGRMRGGLGTVGGIYWCHFPHEFTPIEGVSQIFGHTRGYGVRSEGNNHCVDCIEDMYGPPLLVIEEGRVVDQIIIDPHPPSE